MNNLKNLRTQRNLTQNELCEEMKKINFYINRSTYSKYESGNIEMCAGVLMKFSEFFETSVDYILGITDNSAPIAE